MIPALRTEPVNAADLSVQGDYILYWMIAARRVRWNFALERAVELARQTGKPLLVFEPLRCDYPWASPRLHRFVIQGMIDNAARLADTHVTYYPWVEARPGEGRGLLERLAGRAAAVVSDDFPTFFLPRMVRAAAAKLKVRLEIVDSNGLLPMRQPDKTFLTAHSFRRHLQRHLPEQLEQFPAEYPLRGDPLTPMGPVPAEVRQRWPAADLGALAADLSSLPLDDGVEPVETDGGAVAGEQALRRFLEDRIGEYAEHRNEPQREVTSGLSPYLHFGHVASHQVVSALLESAGWTPDRLSDDTSGKRRGWWGLDESAEAFLDQVVTWRELGFNMAHRRGDHREYDSLPDWSKQTLEQHAGDERDHLYEVERFEAAQTHDELWNAAQTQLVREGRIHNYLRMLWGKKILEWTAHPAQALEVMVRLNDRYALDGRDPNSYSGILWCLGRYDRPWGPERPVFGKIRYMTSHTARKVRVTEYVQRFR